MQQFALFQSPYSGRVALHPVSGSHIACEAFLTFRDEKAAQAFLDKSKAVKVRGGETINGTYQMELQKEKAQ